MGKSTRRLCTVMCKELHMLLRKISNEEDAEINHFYVKIPTQLCKKMKLKLI